MTRDDFNALKARYGLNKPGSYKLYFKKGDNGTTAIRVDEESLYRSEIDDDSKLITVARQEYASKGNCWAHTVYIYSFNDEDNLLNMPTEHKQSGWVGFNGTEYTPCPAEFGFEHGCKVENWYDSSD